MNDRRSYQNSGKHLWHRRLLVEQLESRRLLAGVWQNPRNALDVDDSGIVSPVDALQVINDLDDNGSRQLPLSRPTLAAYLDVNGDGWTSPVDALMVINAIEENRQPLAITAGLSPDSDPDGNGVVLLDEKRCQEPFIDTGYFFG